MALYIPHSIFHLALFLYVRPETFGPYYICVTKLPIAQYTLPEWKKWQLIIEYKGSLTLPAPAWIQVMLSTFLWKDWRELQKSQDSFLYRSRNCCLSLTVQKVSVLTSEVKCSIFFKTGISNSDTWCSKLEVHSAKHRFCGGLGFRTCQTSYELDQHAWSIFITSVVVYAIK